MLPYPEIISGLLKCDPVFCNCMSNEVLSSIIGFVRTNNGTAADAEDVFQDTMLVFLNKYRGGVVDIHTGHLGNYLIEISRNCWRDRLRDQRRKIRSPINWLQDSNLPDNYETNELKKYRLIQKHLRCMRPRCRKTLRLYMERKSIEEICRIMRYKNCHTASSTLFKCRSSLNKRIKRDPDYCLCNIEW